MCNKIICLNHHSALYMHYKYTLLVFIACEEALFDVFSKNSRT